MSYLHLSDAHKTTSRLSLLSLASSQFPVSPILGALRAPIFLLGALRAPVFLLGALRAPISSIPLHVSSMLHYRDQSFF